MIVYSQNVAEVDGMPPPLLQQARQAGLRHQRVEVIRPQGVERETVRSHLKQIFSNAVMASDPAATLIMRCKPCACRS